MIAPAQEKDRKERHGPCPIDADSCQYSALTGKHCQGEVWGETL